MKELSKEYKSAGKVIPVLSDISCNLATNQVTLLLGSNGAGKTTLMKILSGLDAAYSGDVIWNDECEESMMEEKERRRRAVGWCPQTEALFSSLTVREHVELFQQLFLVSNGGVFHALYRVPTAIARMCTDELRKLNMLEHEHKAASQLSGGMKRRLSLLLAAIGSPRVMLLDEPTSGCDSWTRELVRKDILARKETAAVLVSTHHTDDIDVLADRVWFIDERHLVFDGEVSSLRKLGQSSSPSRRGNGNGREEEETSLETIEFLTWDEQVRRAFVRAFQSCAGVIDSSSTSESATGDRSVLLKSWEVPTMHTLTLKSFVKRLEETGNTNWSVTSFQIFKSLRNMYGNTDASVPSSEPSAGEESLRREVHIHVLWNISVMLWLRLTEQKKRMRTFMIVQMWLPFIIVFCLCLGCRDVNYPKVELTSANINGLGEICLSRYQKGNNPAATGSINIVENTHRSLHSPANNGINGINGTDSFAAFIEATFSASLTRMDGLNSDALWERLFDEYNDHSLHRWGAFVLSDYVPQWMETTILLSSNSLRLDVKTVFDNIRQAASRICQSRSTNSSSADEEEKEEEVDRIVICPPNPSTVFSLHNSTEGADHGANARMEYFIAISTYEALYTNITLLSNVTTDHASPIFLREMFPIVFKYLRYLSAEKEKKKMNDSDAGFFEGGSLPLTNSSDASVRPGYVLYTHPFYEANTTNFAFLQRGYLGSTIILLYMLLTTIVSVRFITKVRSGGVKRQLHLGGMPPTAYWIGNFLFDTCILLTALISAFFAISIGGEPIRSYFFFYSSRLVLVLMALLATAVVASSYALCALSHDQLTSQLFMLVSTISSGVFLRLYLDRYKYYPFTLISNLFLSVSPTYTFCTAMFFVFQQYEGVVTAVTAVDATRRSASSGESHELFLYATILLLQTLTYLAVCVVVDTKWVSLQSLLLRLRWFYSTHVYFSSKGGGSHRSPSSPPSPSSPLSPPRPHSEHDRLLSPGDDGWRRRRRRMYSDEEEGEEGDDAVGVPHRGDGGDRQGVLRQLRARGNVGIFPIIDHTHYRLAMERCASEKAAAEASLIELVIPRDVEEEEREKKEKKKKKKEEEEEEEEGGILRADNLFVEYSHSSSLALTDLTFRYPGSSRIALMGMNGCGKSTLFKSFALADCIPLSGTASIKGE